tara:strand:+ start:18 stop:470 length:453 start_codon:yes stop_codon:yes gene_type:complete
MGLTTKNILFLLLTTIIFILLSVPFTYNLTNDLLKPVGFSTVTKNGCPSIVGILGHSLVFLVLILILFMILNSSKSYFRCLANSGRMNLCNKAQLAAKKYGRDDCAKAALTCIKNPDDNSQECSKALAQCSQKSSPVQKYVVKNCSNLAS